MPQEITGPRRITTKSLNVKIDDAIKNLLVHFNVTEDELKRFKKPKIMRTLNPSKYPEEDVRVPGYSFTENFFYFPLKYEKFDIFSKDVIYHEVGHYIHNFINPGIVKEISIELETGKSLPGYRDLLELVAEYGNFILGHGEKNKLRLLILEEEIEIYKKYGKEFLPCLARMSLEEAIAKGIVNGPIVIASSQSQIKQEISPKITYPSSIELNLRPEITYTSTP